MVHAPRLGAAIGDVAGKIDLRTGGRRAGKIIRTEGQRVDRGAGPPIRIVLLKVSVT